MRLETKVLKGLSLGIHHREAGLRSLIDVFGARMAVSHLVGLLLVANLVIHTQAADPGYTIPAPSCNHGQDMGIVCGGDAKEGDANEEEGGIRLTVDAANKNGTYSRGYVFLIKPVKILDPKTSRVASFNTSFTFNITFRHDQTYGGDGLSFLMFPNQSYQGDPGGYLGVYKNSLEGQETKIFSVEFDTRRNGPTVFNDSSANHVGVNVGSITSRITRNASDVNIQLDGGHAITSWIDYDGPRKKLDVRIANNSNQKPLEPFISYDFDLSTVVEEEMSVGIGASTGEAVQFYDLLNWNFTSFGLPDDPKPSSTNLIIGISVGVATVAVLLLLCCIGWTLYRARRERALDRDFESQLPLEDMPFRFTYKQLSVATKGFNEGSRLGEGGSSSVYKGVIVSTGTPVAVKKVHVAKNRTEGEKLFAAEISVISRLRHRNLVKLLGWCRDRGHYLLVYELLPKGSLDKILFENDGANDSILSWKHRSAIVRGVAAALAYLHGGYAQQVIHRDIKSSNVMLDEEFNPKVGDFGLARLIDHSKNLETMHVAGTLGYIAPEAIYEGVTNDKTDVYAFGMLALEIACGRPPIATIVSPEEPVLADWVWKCYAEGDILKAADQRLMALTDESDQHDLSRGAEIMKIQLMGLLCCHPNPDDRPSMRDVELYLAGHVPLPPVPSTKPLLHFSNSLGQILEENHKDEVPI